VLGWVNLDADLGYRWVIFACRFTLDKNSEHE
jgi:hypothetical protein